MERTPILFVDDDPNLCFVFERTMGARGFDVTTAAGPEKALAAASGNVDFPVIITDLWMPGGDGITLIKALRERQPETSFIVVTGSSDLNLPPSADPGIVGVLRKPWDDDELVDLIGRAARAADERQHYQVNAGAALIDARVLLLEDSPSDSRLVQSLLKRTRCTITHAERVAEALPLLKEQAFDVVLVDLGLPDARGLDAVRRIASTSSAAVIVLSGLHDDALAAQAVELGAQDFIGKSEVTRARLERALRYSLERKRAERQLTRMAQQDSLTGLANRARFEERATFLVSEAQRGAAAPTVMVVDLDGFKPVNDNFGHAVGDQMLRLVADRLREALRSDDLIARLGGDEFAVLVPQASPANAARVADRVLRATAVRLPVGNDVATVNGSIGVARYPQDGTTIEDLLKAADDAMYRSKREGGARWSGMSADSTPKPAATVPLTPVRKLRDRTPLAYRAAPLPATRDHWLQELARAAAAVVSQSAASDLHFPLYDRDPTDDRLGGLIRERLDTAGLPPERLWLEVGQSLDPRWHRGFEGLRAIGVRLALRTSGCIALLDQPMVERLVLDGQVTASLGRTGARPPVALALSRVARSMGLSVVAEGVDDPKVAERLAEAGCDAASGHWADPAPEAVDA